MLNGHRSKPGVAELDFRFFPRIADRHCTEPQKLQKQTEGVENTKRFVKKTNRGPK